ncbi:hypothetical protein DLJ49_12130 [Rhodovulum sp. 12E13]|nr:hypothetical protein DLJ49_12130 [Rhodovulum sp. 12E13]
MLLPVEGGAESVISASASGKATEPGLPPRATRPPQPRPSPGPAALPPTPGGLWPLAPEPALFLPTSLLAESRVGGMAGADPAEGADPAL